MQGRPKSTYPYRPPTPKELEGASSKQVSKITQLVKKELDNEDYDVVLEVTKNILDTGMSLEDCCLLANVEFKTFHSIQQAHPIVSKLLKVKEIEYKAGLLKSINREGKKNDKTAMWLLENRYRDEFGKKRSQKEEGDVLAIALELIQTEGNNEPIVKRESRKAVIVKKSGIETVTKKLKEFIV